MVLVQGGFEWVGIVGTVGAVEFFMRVTERTSDHVIVVVVIVPLAAPKPPCDDRQTSQNDGPAHANHDANYSPLRGAAEAGTAATGTVTVERWDTSGGHSL